METTGDLGYGTHSLVVVGTFLVAILFHIWLWNKNYTFCVKKTLLTNTLLHRGDVFVYIDYCTHPLILNSCLGKLIII